MAFSIARRGRLCGGARSGRITPVACQGPCWAGSLLPEESPANARRSLRACDLNIKICITRISFQRGAHPSRASVDRQPVGNRLGLQCPPPETPELPASELLALRRPAHRRGALVLVAEDQPAFLEVVRRHLDGDAVARQRFDAVLLHLAGRVVAD